MWSVAGIREASSKILQYITLLKVKKIYEHAQLFRMILTEKINDSSREEFYRKYEMESKGQQGWTEKSLLEFNHHEGLDFDERQLKFLFGELDRDKSGVINQEELVFMLTGLK